MRAFSAFLIHVELILNVPSFDLKSRARCQRGLEILQPPFDASQTRKTIVPPNPGWFVVKGDPLDPAPLTHAPLARIPKDKISNRFGY